MFGLELMNFSFYDSERTDMKCFLHLTLKRDLLNVVWISSGKEFQILAPM